MDRDGGDISHRFHIPNLPEQLVLGEYMVGILRKEGQKIKFLGGKILLLPIDIDPSCRLVDLQAPDLDDLIFRHTASDETLISG